jgi:NAD(P)H-flavin reductase
VIGLHRWLGRATIGITTAHSVLAMIRWADGGLDVTTQTFGERKYQYGFVGWMAALVLLVTSVEPVRRRCWNFFMTVHLMYFVFYAFAFLHTPEYYRPYLLAAVALWGLNKLGQLFWGLLPRRTARLELLPDNVVCVTFAKHRLAEWLGLYRVGQYAFVNFPRLSMFAWHPFTLASGPREPVCRIYVKGLGDWTSELVRRAKAKEYMWIRVDGPYGGTNLDRFPNLLLVAGGIGATPVVSILRDLYDIGLPCAAQEQIQAQQAQTQEKQRQLVLGRPSTNPLFDSYWNVESSTDPDPDPKDHIYEAVAPVAMHRSHLRNVHVVWTVRSTDQLEWFAELWPLLLQRSQQPGYPSLHLAIHITSLREPLPDRPYCVPGRPDLHAVLDSIASASPKEAVTKVFCCGPKAMVDTVWAATARHNRAHPSGPVFVPHSEKFEF